MSVEETEKTVEIAGDRKLPIQRNATLDTAAAEDDDDDDDMTVGTNNTSSGASARSDGLIAACIGDEEEEELDITAIAAKRYRQSKQEEKQTRHDSRNGHYKKNADCDSLDSEEAWMRQPIGGPGGENIPASFVSPPKKVASEAPVPHSASTSSSSSPPTIEGIETILHADDLSVESRSVSSNVDDSNGENTTTPLDFAPDNNPSPSSANRFICMPKGFLATSVPTKWEQLSTLRSIPPVLGFPMRYFSMSTPSFGW